MSVVGRPATATHWARGLKWYGHAPPSRDAFMATLYWPLSDPKPQRRWWR